MKNNYAFAYMPLEDWGGDMYAKKKLHTCGISVFKDDMYANHDIAYNSFPYTPRNMYAKPKIAYRKSLIS